MSYAGDVSPKEAWDALSANQKAVLVDVRTNPEWTFVGVPDLRSVGKKAGFICWQVYPQMQVDGEFAARVAQFARIATLLGENTAGKSDDEASLLAITAVEKLRADIGIPHRLSELEVKETQLRAFAEKAASIKRVCRVNPRPVTADDLEGILKSAL